ncbi:MAG: ArsC/Spx/MgsR family protein [Pseudomonadota bacterium]
MRIFGIKTCDTCRKARRVFADAEFVDVRDDGLPEAIKAQALEMFGDALINRKSTTWRGLDEAARDQEADALLSMHPTLMKRPLIEANGTLYLGWTKSVQEDLGAKSD